ncbi:MAG: mannose-1-phosphate guanylyltransferase [Bacteroidales bacterium]|nr:mannose-1-phosphate guanylyltransferase [Bacteroidales bacterium]
MSNNQYCIIMAGGIGSRFWPLSRNSMPKQFLDILGIGKSFLQLTCERFLHIIPKERILVVTSEQYKDLVKHQLPDLPEGNILAEPYRRNTAPCIAYATYKLMKTDPKATVVVAPSDHLIVGDEAFLSTIRSALQFASQKDVLITLGIKPSRPETGYGYIQAVKQEGVTVQDHLAYPVKTFTEKPDATLAGILIESGEFYWNSGIFVWSLASIAKQLERWIPEVSQPFRNGLSLYNTQHEEKFIRKTYEEIRNVSIDYGVMEKAKNTYVFDATFGWSDLGSWESIYMHYPKDAKNNATSGSRVHLDNVTGTLVYASEKEKLIVVKDLENYIVVDTPDALLICPRDNLQFRQLFNDIAHNHEEFV